MLALIVVGLARSGKDTVADYLVEKFGFEKFVFSDILAEKLKEQSKTVSKLEMVKLGDNLRKEQGNDVLARLVFEKSKNKDRVVFVGARSVEEVNYLKKKFENCFVVKVLAESDNRFERKSELDPVDEKEFFSRDEIDIEKKGLKEVLRNGDFIIINDGTLDSLYSKVDALITEILG